MTIPRLFTYAAIIILLLCPVTFAAGMFAPRTLGFLDSTVCPPGYTLDNHTEPAVDSEGDQVMRTTLVCINSAGQSEDATGKVLPVLLLLPVLAVVVYFVGTRFGKSKTKA